MHAPWVSQLLKMRPSSQACFVQRRPYAILEEITLTRYVKDSPIMTSAHVLYPLGLLDRLPVDPHRDRWNRLFRHLVRGRP
jgi:hypothetical protein